mmetsp:Transcript_104217/g.290328  ORF Transcript_104217/g.290328 Transcript_104217/m.290328 type:complete len:81 (-) Transcript_104217:318-560(-)
MDSNTVGVAAPLVGTDTELAQVASAFDSVGVLSKTERVSAVRPPTSGARTVPKGTSAVLLEGRLSKVQAECSAAGAVAEA